MKKGIIFTIDALLALSILIAVIVALYSHFGTVGEFEVVATSIYAGVDSEIFSWEESELFSTVILLHQKNNTSESLNLLEDLSDSSIYKINIYLFLFEYDEVKNPNIEMISKERNILKSENYDFDENFLIRRFATYTITENIFSNGTFSAPSALAGETIEVYDLPEDNSYLEVYNSEHKEMNWNIQQTSDTTYNITIPEDSIIGTYYVKAEDNTIDTFNVFRFGMIVAEVGI